MNLPSFLCGGAVFLIAYAVVSTPEGRSLAKRAATYIKQDLENAAPTVTPPTGAAPASTEVIATAPPTAAVTLTSAPKEVYNAEH